MTTTPTPPKAPSGFGPDTEMTPQCQVGRLYEPDWRDGCLACQYPGYQHPVLGWIDIPCACSHHAAGAS